MQHWSETEEASRSPLRLALFPFLFLLSLSLSIRISSSANWNVCVVSTCLSPSHTERPFSPSPISLPSSLFRFVSRVIEFTLWLSLLLLLPNRKRSAWRRGNKPALKTTTTTTTTKGKRNYPPEHFLNVCLQEENVLYVNVQRYFCSLSEMTLYYHGRDLFCIVIIKTNLHRIAHRSGIRFFSSLYRFFFFNADSPDGGLGRRYRSERRAGSRWRHWPTGSPMTSARANRRVARALRSRVDDVSASQSARRPRPLSRAVSSALTWNCSNRRRHRKQTKRNRNGRPKTKKKKKQKMMTMMMMMMMMIMKEGERLAINQSSARAPATFQSTLLPARLRPAACALFLSFFLSFFLSCCSTFPSLFSCPLRHSNGSDWKVDAVWTTRILFFFLFFGSWTQKKKHQTKKVSRLCGFFFVRLQLWLSDRGDPIT